MEISPRRLVRKDEANNIRHSDPPEAERSLNVKPKIIMKDFSARGLGRKDDAVDCIREIPASAGMTIETKFLNGSIMPRAGWQ